jgi:hypothetical protein
MSGSSRELAGRGRRNRGRGTAMAAVITVVAAACGGSGGGAPTEEGAMEAVEDLNRGLLRGDAGAVLDFLSQDCRDSIDEDQVTLGIAFISALMSEGDVDLDDIGITTSIEEFDGETASVLVEWDVPDGADDGFGFEDETIDVVYEDGKWVSAECEFEDTSEADERALDEALAELGYAGTRDEPVPAGVAVPVGGGYYVSIDAVDTDPAARLEAEGAFMSEPEAGVQRVLVDVTVGFDGDGEPESVGGGSLSIVGGASAVGADLFGCSGAESELPMFRMSLMRGGAASGSVCADVPVDDVPGMVVSVSEGFGDRSVYFDPTTTASTPVAFETVSGPHPDGELTEARQSPIALGTATDIGEGWTLTIDGANLAGTEAVLAASEFNTPPIEGEEYVLVTMTLAYDGEDDSSSPFDASIRVVGDSNVAISSTCPISLDTQLDEFSDVFQGGAVSGDMCFRVPVDDTSSLVLLAATGFDEEFQVFALR